MSFLFAERAPLVPQTLLGFLQYSDLIEVPCHLVHIVVVHLVGGAFRVHVCRGLGDSVRLAWILLRGLRGLVAEGAGLIVEGWASLLRDALLRAGLLLVLGSSSILPDEDLGAALDVARCRVGEVVLLLDEPVRRVAPGVSHLRSLDRRVRLELVHVRL